MTTQYTTNKAIAYPQNNDTGWGTTLNTGISDIDYALGTTQAMNLQSVSGTVTLVSAFTGSYPANSASYVPLILSLTGAPTAAVTIVVPSGVGGQWIVRNACAGTYASVTIASGGGGSSTAIPGAQTRCVFSDGTNISFADSQTASAGSTTQVIYNNAGSLTGSANLTFDGTTLTTNAESVTNALTVGTTVTAGGIIKSTSGGFTFPDNTNQTSAATVAGIIPSAFSGLKITAASLTVTVTSNYVALFNGTSFYTAAAPSLTIAANTTGANGLDTGSLATNWYSVWVIYNPTTTTVAGLLSLSATAPTLPSGYTFKARVGWVRAASGSALVNTVQYGNRAQYTLVSTQTYPSAITGSASVWTSVSIANYAPTTNSAVKGVIVCGSGAGSTGLYAAVSPNTIPTPSNAPSPSAPNWAMAGGGFGSGTVILGIVPFEFSLETANTLYYASNTTGGGLSVTGWTDNL